MQREKGRKTMKVWKGRKKEEKTKEINKKNKSRQQKETFEERGVGRTKDPNPVKVQEIGLSCLFITKETQKTKNNIKKKQNQ